MPVPCKDLSADEKENKYTKIDAQSSRLPGSAGFEDENDQMHLKLAHGAFSDGACTGDGKRHQHDRDAASRTMPHHTFSIQSWMLVRFTPDSTVKIFIFPR